MTILEHIDRWAKLCESEEVINEYKNEIPIDRDMIINSFKEDISDEKYAPTREFIQTAYDILNEKFFEDKLPDRLVFDISNSPRASFMGLARCRINNLLNMVTATSITLNGSRKMTLHNWLEVVLHEMIHVLDYETQPQHFLGHMRKQYDSHGSWFMNEGKRFEQYGFHVERFCKSEMEIDPDNTRVRNHMNNSVFIMLKGLKDTDQIGVIKTTRKNLSKMIGILKDVQKYRNPKLEISGLLRTDNPNIIRLKEVRMKNYNSGYSWYWYNDNFKKKYGPFQEIDMNSINEDKDEVDYDEMNHIDDEYARSIYDNIGGVYDVEKIDDDEYEISLW